MAVHWTTYSCNQCGVSENVPCQHFAKAWALVQERESSPNVPPAESTYSCVDAKEAPMSDHGMTVEGCLAEVEGLLESLQYDGYGIAGAVIETLAAEVLRLRRENHLLNLSRGTPSPLVGLD